MKVDLSDSATRKLEEILEGGRYDCTEQVLDTAVALLAQHERAFWDDVNQKLDEARQDLDEGRARPLPETYFDDLREYVRLRGKLRHSA